MKVGATLEPRENVNCGGSPRGAPNGKSGLEEATPGAAVEATTIGAGFDVLSSEDSPGAKGTEGVVVVGVMDELEGGLREVGRPPMEKV